MPKSPNHPIGPEFSKDREFAAVLEDLHSEFRAFGEGLTDVQEKVSHISEELKQVKEDVALMKSAFPTLATKKDLEQFNKRLTAVESR